MLYHQERSRGVSGTTERAWGQTGAQRMVKQEFPSSREAKQAVINFSKEPGLIPPIYACLGAHNVPLGIRICETCSWHAEAHSLAPQPPRLCCARRWAVYQTQQGWGRRFGGTRLGRCLAGVSLRVICTPWQALACQCLPTCIHQPHSGLARLLINSVAIAGKIR